MDMGPSLDHSPATAFAPSRLPGHCFKLRANGRIFGNILMDQSAREDPEFFPVASLALDCSSGGQAARILCAATQMAGVSGGRLMVVCGIVRMWTGRSGTSSPHWIASSWRACHSQNRNETGTATNRRSIFAVTADARLCGAAFGRRLIKDCGTAGAGKPSRLVVLRAVGVKRSNLSPYLRGQASHFLCGDGFDRNDHAPDRGDPAAKIFRLILRPSVSSSQSALEAVGAIKSSSRKTVGSASAQSMTSLASAS